MAKERPLLMKPFLVIKTAEGIKTETRRVVTSEWSRCLDLDDPEDVAQAIVVNPCGRPGDLLWVWETLRYDFIHILDASTAGIGISFKAGGYGINLDLRGRRKVLLAQKGEKHGDSWRPSIFMPKHYCRLRLKVKEVRVERLHKITTDEVIAEGFEVPDVDYTVPDFPWTLDWERDCYARELFAKEWTKINKARGYGWETNPHVFVVKFEVQEQHVLS